MEPVYVYATRVVAGGVGSVRAGWIGGQLRATDANVRRSGRPGSGCEGSASASLQRGRSGGSCRRRPDGRPRPSRALARPAAWPFSAAASLPTRKSVSLTATREEGPAGEPRGRAPRESPARGRRGRATREGDAGGRRGRATREGDAGGPHGRAGTREGCAPWSPRAPRRPALRPACLSPSPRAIPCFPRPPAPRQASPAPTVAPAPRPGDPVRRATSGEGGLWISTTYVVCRHGSLSSSTATAAAARRCAPPRLLHARPLTAGAPPGPQPSCAFSPSPTATAVYIRRRGCQGREGRVARERRWRRAIGEEKGGAIEK